MDITALILALNIASLGVAIFLLVIVFWDKRPILLSPRVTPLSSNQQQLQILQASYDTSLAIMKQFEQRASEILHRMEEARSLNTSDINAAFKKLVDLEITQLQKDSEDQIAKFHEQVTEERANYISSLQSISTEIHKEYKEILSSFRNDLRAKHLDSERDLQEQIQTQLETLEKDLLNYRESKMRNIDNIVVSLLDRTITKFLDHALTVNQHETILKKLLAEEKTRTDLMFKHVV